MSSFTLTGSCFLAIALSLTGCASEVDDGAMSGTSNLEGGERASRADLRAEVATTTFALDEGPCHVNFELPVVTLANAEVAEKINQSLPSEGTATASCEHSDAAHPTNLVGGHRVTANEAGLLSLIYTQKSLDSVVPGLEGYTFDLHTGAQLNLAAVLTAKGLKAALTACVPLEAKALSMVSPDPMEALAKRGCAAATGSNHAFAVEKEGLRLFIELEGEFVGLEEARTILVPWSALAGGLHPGVVADFVQRAAR